MPETNTRTYDQLWEAREYLRQYYSTPDIAKDERANFDFLASHLGRRGRLFNSALEFGCGPTIHHAAALIPYVRSLDLADYLPENLKQVRYWLDCHPEAHNWDVYLAGVLTAEGERGTNQLVERKELLKRKVSALKHGDIRSGHPLGDGSSYELVASYYCIEAVSPNRTEWAVMLGNLCRLVKPGGVLLLGALRRSREYHVFGCSFPTAYIDEADFAIELPRLGFPSHTTEIKVVSGVGWEEQGFDSICCVYAIKATEPSAHRDDTPHSTTEGIAL